MAAKTCLHKSGLSNPNYKTLLKFLENQAILTGLLSTR